MTRAKNSAVQMAIGATNDDINEIAREIGADKIEQKQMDEGPVIQEEQEVVEETEEEIEAKRNKLMKMMKNKAQQRKKNESD